MSSGAGNAVVYVGRLSTRTQERDLQDTFAKYGRIVRLDFKTGYAFVEYSDARDADAAVHNLDGSEFDGSRILVEPSHRGEGRCFNCGKEGHWARDCREEPRNRRAGGGRERGGASGSGGGSGGNGGGDRFHDRSGGDRYHDRDRRNGGGDRHRTRDNNRDGGNRRPRGACYNCGEVGHFARDCRKARNTSSGGSSSRGSYNSDRYHPYRRRGGRDRSRSPRSRSRSGSRPRRRRRVSHSRSRSPGDRASSHGRRSGSNSARRSPKRNNSSGGRRRGGSYSRSPSSSRSRSRTPRTTNRDVSPNRNLNKDNISNNNDNNNSNGFDKKSPIRENGIKNIDFDDNAKKRGSSSRSRSRERD